MYYTTNEYKFWKLLRDKMRKEFILSRIESVVSVGIPDVFWAHRKHGTNGWMELKIVHGKKLRFGKEQAAWIKQHAKAGVPVQIIALKHGPATGPNAKSIYLWDGKDIDDVKAHGIESSSALVWSSPFEWPEIIGAIDKKSPAPDPEVSKL